MIVPALAGRTRPFSKRPPTSRQHPASIATLTRGWPIARPRPRPVGEGVAIPHGKLSAVTEIVACLGRARAGVDFDAMDKQSTYLFFVLVAPESSTGAHLKALARISRVFKDGSFRKRLLEAPDADGMFAVIAEEDAKY
jgi:mannitol/fructose-specific phosphotransferase system IIA component (Ntr-type)